MDTTTNDTTTRKKKKHSPGWGGPRPGAGRKPPPGTQPGTRRRVHAIKFSDPEWEQLTARAAAAGLTAAEYVRRKALSGAEHQK